MKKAIYSSIIIMSVIIMGGFFIPQYSEAYTKTKLNVKVENDFAVEPGKTEIYLNPGENMVKNISITNRMDKTVRFKLSTEDFIGTDDPKQPVILLDNNSSPYSLKDFIVPEITQFSLEFGEKITIPVRVSVPKNAEPKGYYGALVVANDPDKLVGKDGKEISGQTQIISRIGALFLMRINGQGKEEGNITSLKVMGPSQWFYTKRPAGFEIGYKNTGNVHLVPYGTITVKNLFRQTISTLPVDAYFVLPESTRYREVNWSDGFSLGRYTANLALNKGYGDQMAYSSIAFWVIPWKVILITLLVIALLYYLYRYISNNFELKKKV